MRIGSRLGGIDLIAHQNLMRSFSELHQSSMRLSTMQQINRGSDDPAGLIAVGDLQAELEAMEAASSNASRAVGAIHVADSAMNEVGGLLNTIRGNVIEAAGGGLSKAEVAAKQMEVDAALEAIDRIGGYTSFGGRKLLDGSQAFNTSGVNPDQVTDLQVHANAGGGEQTVEIEVTEAATQASLTHSDDDGTLDEDLTLQLSGDEGTVAMEFSAGATMQQIAMAVNAASDTTGVTATVDGNDLTLTSAAYGSEATVAVEVVEGEFDTGEATMAAGTDVVANVDGVEVTGDGNSIHVDTETLEADIDFSEGFSGEVDPITVSGSAMTFVFSPDVSNTSTLALPNIGTSALGGSAGRLSDLRSGGSASLASGNAAGAIDILDTAQSQVLGARARAGAFEKYTIESSQRVMDTMEVSLSSALSQIFDTDVAKEASQMMRAQILVDAGISALMIAGRSRGAIGGLLGFL